MSGNFRFAGNCPLDGGVRLRGDGNAHLRAHPVSLTFNGRDSFANSNRSTRNIERLCVWIRVDMKLLDPCGSQIGQSAREERMTNTLPHELRVHPEMLQLNGLGL